MTSIKIMITAVSPTSELDNLVDRKSTVLIMIASMQINNKHKIIYKLPSAGPPNPIAQISKESLVSSVHFPLIM